MDKKKLIQAGIIAASLVAGGCVGAIAHSQLVEPQVITQTVEKNVTVEVPVEVVKEVPVEVIKTVTVTTEVDNGKLAEVLQHIYDNKGSIEYLTEDLKDSEVAQIADRVVLVNDFKAMAVDAVKADLTDLVDKEVVADVTIDDRDVERVRIQDDADEVVVESIDFEDKDAELLVSGTFEHEDVKYAFTVAVEFKDGEVDDTSLDALSVK